MRNAQVVLGKADMLSVRGSEFQVLDTFMVISETEVNETC